MNYYIVTDDLQGGWFGMHRAYTAEEWGVQASEWADSDGSEDYESWKLANYDSEQDLIDDIAEFWELRFAQINEEQKAIYDGLVEYSDKYGYSAEIKDAEGYWKFIDNVREAEEVRLMRLYKRKFNSLGGFIVTIKDDKVEIAETGLGDKYGVYDFKKAKFSVLKCVEQFLNDYFE